MNLFIDIETIPTDRQDFKEYIASRVKHPGNITKPESIEKWNQESRAQAVDEEVRKTSLDGAFGRVCCIGFAFDDGDVNVIYSADDEVAVLSEFADVVAKAGEVFSSTVIGHNVSAFDLRFLIQRCVVHRIRPPLSLLRASQARPWEADKVFDTMVQWAGIGGKVGLEKLCLALDIESPKSDIDGSQVWEFVRAGRIAEVAAYCKRDVEQMRQAYMRMTFTKLKIN